MRHGEGHPGPATTRRSEGRHPDAAVEQRELRRDEDPQAQREQPRMTAAMAWQDIKSRFVDDPGAALAAADDLVRRAIEERLQRFQQELEELRRDPPDAEAPTSTEEMRQRLVRYQAYFERLVHPTTH